MSSIEPACTPCVLMLVACRSPRLMPPCVGFRATLPQNPAGRMIEPPTCVPMAAGSMRAATAAADPEEEPPGVRVESNGLRVGPGSAPAELGRHGLAENDGAGLAQGPHRRVVALGEIAAIGLAAHLGRHVLGFEQVLDADRHAVDGRQRAPGLPSRRARIGGGARARLVERRKRLHDRLALGNRLQAALEIGARAIGALAKPRGGIVKRQRLEGPRIVASAHRSCSWLTLPPLSRTPPRRCP